MSIQTLAQQRAKHAWEVVEAQRARSTGFEEFADQAKKLPMRILTSGLGQTLAFVEAKGKAPELLQALTGWMAIYQPGTGKLLERVIQGNSDFQRLATAECLAYLEWLVRFADAHKKE
jgi:CRISPR-associated protein Cmr5